MRLQREDQERLNSTLRAGQMKRGLVLNDVDPAVFRRRLSGVYGKWKGTLGTKCWSLIEKSAGSLA